LEAPQINGNDALWLARALVLLEKIQKGLTETVCRLLRRKQFSGELGLLRCASIPKVKKYGFCRVEGREIHMSHVPANIEVSREVTLGDEAAIDKSCLTTGKLQ
jgi:hypothetical protein